MAYPYTLLALIVLTITGICIGELRQRTAENNVSEANPNVPVSRRGIASFATDRGVGGGLFILCRDHGFRAHGDCRFMAHAGPVWHAALA